MLISNRQIWTYLKYTSTSYNFTHRYLGRPGCICSLALILPRSSGRNGKALCYLRMQWLRKWPRHELAHTSLWAFAMICSVGFCLELFLEIFSWVLEWACGFSSDGVCHAATISFLTAFSMSLHMSSVSHLYSIYLLWYLSYINSYSGGLNNSPFWN